jgi:hypothetical protein
LTNKQIETDTTPNTVEEIKKDTPNGSVEGKPCPEDTKGNRTSKSKKVPDNIRK